MARNLPLTDGMIELIARRFRILGEPQRLRILQALECGEKTVNEIVDTVSGNQSNISRHLHSLFEAGLVGRRREGNFIYYSITDPVIFKLCDIVCRSASEQMQHKVNALTARGG
jgi:DNA-binding transcriptional ArsR family regulator